MGLSVKRQLTKDFEIYGRGKRVGKYQRTGGEGERETIPKRGRVRRSP
jgi:hypothetical protein